VRNDIKDPLTTLLQEQGMNGEIDELNPTNVVFSFPKKSPLSSVKRSDISAIAQLDHYKMFRDNWCEHNVSITIYIRPNEWLAVGDWVYRNWDDVGGISFLPYTDHIYQQAPFVEITEEQYNEMFQKMPEIDYSKISDYEKDDQTTATHELACTAGQCEI